LVGWLPIVKEDSNETGKKDFVNLKRVVWHEGFKELFESIIQYAKTGIMKLCGDGIRRWLFPIILMLSADYEEQCVMALIRGIGSACPCPKCLDIYKKAQQLESEEEKEALLKSVGLRDIENVFWSLERTDVYAALSWDRLHSYHGGMFSDHLWVQFKKAIMKAGEYTDGRKYEDMSKIIVFASHNILSETDRGYLLLQLIRSYLELDMYASLTMHTDRTLEA
ncbi:hypothetical protein BDN70DRAFT_770837, partial [Pholiota conissans]